MLKRNQNNMLMRFFAYLLVALILTPIIWISAGFDGVDAILWHHLWNYTIPPLLEHTFILLIGVVCGVSIIAIPLAWWCTAYEFPGRKILEWLLIVPVAIPAYVMAFALLGWFDLTGSLSLIWRATFNSAPPWPSLRSAFGAVLFLSLGLYPYLFLLLRQAWSGYIHRALENGQMLGHSVPKSLWRIIIPSSRPYIFAALALIMMEVLADFGTVSILNYDTFTTAIYKAWYGFFSLSTAVQLSGFLLVFVFIIYAGEQYMRKHQRVLQQNSNKRWKLSRTQGIILCLYSGTVVLFSLILPIIQLIMWAWNDPDYAVISHLYGSVWAGLCSAFLVTTVAIYMAWFGHHVKQHPWWLQLSQIGYAVPGSILAVGLLSASSLLPYHVLQGTLIFMLWGYLTRFFSVGFSNIDTGFKRIHIHHEQSAKQLGSYGWSLFHRLYAPMLYGSTGTAFVMIFVDTIKEIPITLMTRPFGFDTLASRIFSLTSEGDWQRASSSALCLVLVSLIPTYWLAKRVP